MNFGVQVKSIENKRDFTKPNEDYYIADVKNGIYIVADGVTRPHREYQGDSASMAKDVSRLFCDSLHRHIIEYETRSDRRNMKETLFRALFDANQEIKSYNDEHPSDFLACTAFICCRIDKDHFYFMNACDCFGLLVRDKRKIIFADILNSNVKKTPDSFDKRYIYDNLYNNISDFNGYAMVNGDSRLMDIIDITSMELLQGDRIIVASDGFYECLINTPGRKLVGKSVDELQDLSGYFDLPPYNKYADDKTIIIIDVS